MEYLLTNASTTTTAFVPGQWSNQVFYTSAGSCAVPSPPREPSPLEWLDAEIEATCALARMAA